MTIETKSFTSIDEVYNVTVSDATYKAISCSCPDHQYRNRECKHMKLYEANRLATIRMMEQSF